VLYWCDQRLNKIERVDLNTREATLLVSNVTDRMGLSVHEEHIYWVDMYVLSYFTADLNFNPIAAEGLVSMHCSSRSLLRC